MKISYKNTITAVGAFLTAILASTCCITPFLAIAGFLGVSVSQLVWLASIKNYLIIVSLFAIAYSLYKAYKKTKNMENLSCCPIENNSTQKRSVNGVIRSKLFLWIMVFLTLATLLLPYVSSAQQEQAVKEVSVTFKVEKLTQSCCIGIIEYSVKNIKGFKKLKADVKAKEVTVWFDPKETTKTKIKEAIDKSGYIALLKQ